MRSATYLPQMLTVAVLSTAAVAKTPSLFPLDLQFVAISLNGQNYADKLPTLTIKHDPKSNALVGTGFAGCNQWTSRVTLEGEQFGFSNIGATKMFCTVLEGDQTQVLFAPDPTKKL
jgi:heat shock protein HslJ